MRFTELIVENWRNFTRFKAGLQRRVFLVGPNASGKSNLLDVFRFLHEIVAIGGGFREAVARRGGVSRSRCLAAGQYPEIVIRVRIGNEEAQNACDYELRFNQDKQHVPKITKEIVRH